uniref:Putative conserved plasma membrane protein n=1 Tax=Culex tarsalis TaxID=7177 RepID=A0A1Q3FRN1_CULTA
MVTKQLIWAKVQKMYRGFVKFNGYTVAVSCINYAITCVLNSKVDGGIGAIVPFLKSIMDNQKEPESPVLYLGLFVASIMLFMAVFWRCKALIIPFIVSYTLVVEKETDGKFKFKAYWQALFTIYTAVTILLLLLQGICSCCGTDPSTEPTTKDVVDYGSHGNLQPRSRCQRILAFFCCGTCCYRKRKLNRLDSQSHCSCDTLNIRIAGPHDKHYHRVVFV